MKKIAVAPMLDYTNRHFRFFMRLISKEIELYSEMIVADALIYGNKNKLLEYSYSELPLILQLGGFDPLKLADAAQLAESYGYTGVNLNVGCPSDRVKSGNFGACLMKQPKVVIACINAMSAKVKTIPISIKHRIGLNYVQDYDFLYEFVFQISRNTNCKDFIIHARNAVLNGLTPKQNREIPPLNYEFLYKLKNEFKELNIMLNGGVQNISEVIEHLKFVDGVMIGRAIYNNPFDWINVDSILFNKLPQYKSRIDVAYAMRQYLVEQQQQGVKLHHITHHILGLFYGCNNAKLWRHNLTHEIRCTNDIATYDNLLNLIFS